MPHKWGLGVANDGDDEKASGSTPSGASGKYPKTMNLDVFLAAIEFLSPEVLQDVTCYEGSQYEAFATPTRRS